MLGTHIPTNIASSVFPLKNRISEYTKERLAEMNSNLSVSENFLNIRRYCLMFVELSFRAATLKAVLQNEWNKGTIIFQQRSVPPCFEKAFGSASW